MGQQLIDPRTADRFLSGALAPEDAPPGLAEVARLLQAARKPPTPQELARCADTVAAMATVLADSPAVPSTQTTKRAGLSRLLRPRIAATMTAGALVLSFGGLAEAGVLPRPVQHAASVLLSKIGVSIPDSGTPGVVVPAPSSPAGIPGLHPVPPAARHRGRPHESGKRHERKGHGRRHGRGKGHGRHRGHHRGKGHRRHHGRHHGRHHHKSHRGAGARSRTGPRSRGATALCAAWLHGQGEHMPAAAMQRLHALAASRGKSIPAFCAQTVPASRGRVGGTTRGGRHSSPRGRHGRAQSSGGDDRRAHGGKSGNGTREPHGSPLDAPAPPGDAIP